MRRTLFLMAGAVPIFAIAAYVVLAHLGEAHFRAFLSGGAVSLLAVLLGSALARGMRFAAPTAFWAAATLVRFLFALLAFASVPRFVTLDAGVFGGWLVFFYLLLTLLESWNLAAREQAMDKFRRTHE